MTGNQIVYQFYHIKISLVIFIFVWHFLNISWYLELHIFYYSITIMTSKTLAC